jgi:hypothetical protein
VSGYLFCDSFDASLTLLAPIFGIHQEWPRLAANAFTPFIVLLAIALALGSRRAWILTQVYLVIRILVRAVAACAAPMELWHQYSSHPASLPNGTPSSPALFAFIAFIISLNVLVSVVLLLFLRRPDVRSLFEREHVESV